MKHDITTERLQIIVDLLTNIKVFCDKGEKFSPSVIFANAKICVKIWNAAIKRKYFTMISHGRYVCNATEFQPIQAKGLILDTRQVKPDVNNSLSIYSNKQLLAEIKRRGYKGELTITESVKI